MLEKYKKIYMGVAEGIPNWKSKTKSELIREYCSIRKQKSNPKLEEAYMAALMLKYWGALTNYYRQPHNSKVKIEDCYDWLTEALMVVTNKPVFDDEFLYHTYVKTGEVRKKPNLLYGNPDSPNLAMVKCLSSMRLGYYQSANYDNRKLNHIETQSIDGLIEENKDYKLPYSNNIYNNELSLSLKQIIINYFNNKDYLKAFILEGIINGDVFDNKTEGYPFSIKKLVKHLKHLDDNYCNVVADYFGINKDIVIEASQPYRNMSSQKTYNIINKVLTSLKQQLKPDLEQGITF